MFDRTLKLINEKTFQNIQKSNILLIGLGGVGGYTFESLIRSGFLNITIVDMDRFEESNLNRQVLATREVLGKKKVEVALSRAKSIYTACNITTIHKNFTKEDITEEFINKFDYVIDACDTKEVKIALIKVCTNLHIKIISSMGTANRLHPENLVIMKMKDTKNDPLAKVLRKELKGEKKYLDTPVVCSTELPKKQKDLGTIVTVPMVCGALLASYVITDIQKETSGS